MAEVTFSSHDSSARTPSASWLSNVEEVKNNNINKVECTDQEEPESTPTIIHKVTAELVGTYILIFIGCGSAFIDQKYGITLLGVAFAWGFVVMALVYTLGHISGAHVNPAVTIALATARRFPWKQVPLYVVAQVVGSILSGITLRWLFHGDSALLMLALPADKSTHDLNVVAWEIIVTFILMFVISGAATDNGATKELSGVAIGVTVFCNALIAGKESGASMNPARSLGPAIAAKHFDKLVLYIVAPLVGAVAGSTLYTFLRLPENPKKEIVAGKSMELP